MDDVQFETDSQFKIASPSIGIVRSENKMAEWIMRKGLAKSPAQAQRVLLGIAVAAVAIGIAAWFFIDPSQSAPHGSLPPLPQ